MGVFGGTGQVMLRTARLLGSKGWRFAGLCPVGELSHELLASSVRVREWRVADVRVSPRGFVAGSREWAALWSDVGSAIRGASLLHAHSLKACLLAWPACHRAGVPILWHLHDFLPLRRARRFLIRLAECAADGVVAVSHAVAAELRRHDAVIVPNGIEWAPAPVGRRERNLVLFVGRLDPEKRPADFVELASRCRPIWPDIRFVVAGAASPGLEAFEADLRARARRSGVFTEDYLTFAGLVTDIRPLFRTALALVVPSEREPFGLVALEAMREGIPVVGTTGGGLDDIVVDGRTGYLVPPGDVGALQGRLSELLRDRDRLRSMGRLGRERFVKRFRAEAYARRMQAVYKQLLSV
jgi:glycosyltransferase involved in cell wall biosynthesis